jgi:hypothetical protein
MPRASGAHRIHPRRSGAVVPAPEFREWLHGTGEPGFAPLVRYTLRSTSEWRNRQTR